MSTSLRRCIFCSMPEIEARTVGRVIVAWCAGCGAEFCIEFSPPDEPSLRAQIERLDGDDDGVFAEVPAGRGVVVRAHHARR